MFNAQSDNGFLFDQLQRGQALMLFGSDVFFEMRGDTYGLGGIGRLRPCSFLPINFLYTSNERRKIGLQ